MREEVGGKREERKGKREEVRGKRQEMDNDAARCHSTESQHAMDPLQAFETLDVRVGRVIEATVNARARNPSYILRIDFGPLGQRTSSAQLTVHYTPEQLVGRQVVAAMSLGTRNIAGIVSEVLVLGLPDPDGAVVLLAPEQEVPLGGRMY